MSISWFLSRRCILRSLGVNARTGLDSPFSSVVSFSNTFAIAGLSLCSLGRSLNRTCGKNRNDPYMTGAIKGLNWVKTMRYVRSPLPSLFMVGAAYLEVLVFLVRPVSLGYITEIH